MLTNWIDYYRELLLDKKRCLIQRINYCKARNFCRIQIFFVDFAGVLSTKIKHFKHIQAEWRLKPPRNLFCYAITLKNTSMSGESVTVKHYHEGIFSGMSIPAICEFPYRIVFVKQPIWKLISSVIIIPIVTCTNWQPYQRVGACISASRRVCSTLMYCKEIHHRRHTKVPYII